ncbi:MAG: CaiB/BaiF CoA transferase family protein [Xanthobacteraceae bacterium]|uniref:CaiB/BaiF CoA transferase family protein n=1 Tax=Pseudolabrys sp. TaxID=1960880 RepID=UPI003D141BF4
MGLPLAGLRVLDLTRVLAGPWATQLLADLGAEVLKIERPGAGDETRAAGPPFLKDRAGDDTSDSAYFLSANRGKKSVAVNIATPQGQELVRKLAASCDVLVENYMVGKLAEYKLDHASLQATNPRLVYCSITGFGQTGPYRELPGYDFVFQAMGGMMSITGEPDGTPQKVGVAFSDLMTGMYASTAILAALRHRDAGGRGQHIDLSLFDTQIAALANMNMNYLIANRVPKRMGNAHANLVPYQVFRCSDGDVVVAAGNDNLFRGLCRGLGQPALSDDIRFATNPDRVRNRDDLITILSGLFLTGTAAEWIERLRAQSVPVGPINNLQQVFADPHVQDHKMVVRVEHPAAGPVPLVANPIRFSETPIAYENPPPLLGQHTAATLKNLLGLTETQIADLEKQLVVQTSGR